MKLSRFLAATTLALALFSAKPAAATEMWMNMKLGPAIGTSDVPTQFALQFEFGYQVIPNGYLVFPLQFHFGKQLTVIGIPLGFQYDFQIPGVKNLYIYPRIAVGYAIGIQENNTTHSFLLSPGFGVKYVIKQRFQVGFEPFELPIGISDNTGIWYRLTFYAGLRW